MDQRYQFGVVLTREIEAAHYLTSYLGKPEPVHGHTWKIEIALEAPLDAEGMSVDFVKAHRALEEVSHPFDHRCFNEVPPFDMISPSAENIAAHFLKEIAARIPEATVTQVKVWEGPRHYAFLRLSTN